MTAPTHKMVNGKRVDLTEQEIADIEAEWEANRLKKEAEKIIELQRQDQRKVVLEKLGLTEEEVRLLLDV